MGGTCHPTSLGQLMVVQHRDSLQPHGQHFGAEEAGASVTSRGSSACALPWHTAAEDAH